MANNGQPGSVRPPAAAVDAAAQSLLRLVEEQLPTQFPPGEDEWHAYAAAFVCRMSELVRSIFVLMKDGRTIDGGLMLRVLYEHVVKFCWIAADPESRYPIWRSDGLIQRRKLHNDALLFGTTILDDQQLAEARSATAELPSMPQLAEEVDACWGGRIDAFRPRIKIKGEPLQLLTIRGMYIPGYRTLSEPVHGHADVMQAYINGGTPMWPLGPDATDRSMWWTLAVTLFAQALLVCYTVLGAPDPDRVREANNSMYE
jgi:hypothetical protein